MAIREKKLGADHPDLADTLPAYALLLRETKRKSEAKTVDAHARQILARNSSVKAANQTIQVREVWMAAVKEIETAYQIVVIGYSMPFTDTFFQYLLALGLKDNSHLNRIVVVDLDESEDFRQRYKRVFSRSVDFRGRLNFLTGRSFEFFARQLGLEQVARVSRSIRRLRKKLLSERLI